MEHVADTDREHLAQELVAKLRSVHESCQFNAAYEIKRDIFITYLFSKSSEVRRLLVKLLNSQAQDVRSMASDALKELLKYGTSQEMVLNTKGVLNSREVIQLRFIDHRLYVNLFDAFNAQLRECQIQMDGVQVEPPRIFVRGAQQGIRQRGKQHV